MQFNFKDYDVRRDIQRRVDLEDLVRWARAPQPAYMVVPKHDSHEFDHNKTPSRFSRHWIRALMP